MQVSLASFVVLFALVLLGRSLGSTLIVGLIASCAFGSTAVATVTALGGASPLLYNAFATLIILSVLVSRTGLGDLRDAFRGAWVPWVVCGLIIYACASALIMPRLFADQTSTFAVSYTLGFVEVSLSPTPGNILQTGYFVLFALTSLALMASAMRADPTEAMRRGFFAWAIIIAVGGIIDLAAKGAGLGYVLDSIRTANYAYLTEAEEAGVSRISGTFSEASAFAGNALGALAFTFTYWQRTQSRGALALTVCLLVLLILSTSSTAYLGLMVLTVPVTVRTIGSLLRGRDTRSAVNVLAAAVSAATFIALISLVEPEVLDTAQNLIHSTLLDKADSESGRERSYMNLVSLQNVLDTWGLGVGYGSSRSSSWLLAVLSQLGIVGTLLHLLLFLPFLRRMPPATGRMGPSSAIAALHDALQACALALFISQSISGSNANPGILFFVALAGVGACRTWMRYDSLVTVERRRDPPLGSVAAPYAY